MVGIWEWVITVEEYGLNIIDVGENNF